MIGPVTPPDKRSLREKPSNKELLSFGRRAFLLDQRHPADRTFAWLVRVDLRMHPAGVIEVLRICLVRLFFHFIGGFFISSEVFFISSAAAFFSASTFVCGVVS